MRPIDANNATSHCKALANDKWNKKVSTVSWADAYQDFVEYLEELPTVDAVEVCRCKDCKKIAPSVTAIKDSVWCREFRAYMPCDGFCSYGKRRDDG